VPLIPEDKIAEIRERSDIVEIISRYVTLRRAGGANWKGVCPFHDERSPSFNVNKQRQMYHCFGCHASGDVIKFLMEYEKREFIEVVRDLAGQLGVELPEERDPQALREHRERESERDKVFRSLEFACKHFEATLAAPLGERARTYLDGRLITEESKQRFRLGYATADWDRLWAQLEKHVPRDIAQKAGLVGVSEKTGRPYDFFRDRVMLPVIDRSGRVIAFGSRLLDPEAKDRKYVNSPDSPVFHKKEQLYGLHAARDAMRRTGRGILVEGNFDVITLHQAGFEETVAPMGTAITAEQLDLLRRFVAKLVVIFDGDAAGQAAAEKAAPLFARSGMDVRVVTLGGEGKKVDPDELVRTAGPDALRTLIDRADSLLEHVLERVARAADATVHGRRSAIERVAPVFEAVDSKATRDLYMGHLAGKLGIPLETVRQGLAEAARRQQRGEPAPAPAEVQPQAVRTAEKWELHLLCQLTRRPQLGPTDPEARATFLARVSDDAMRALLALALEGKTEPEILASAPLDLMQAVARAYAEDLTTDEATAARVFRLAHEELDRAFLKRELGRLESQLHSADEADRLSILAEISRIKAERHSLREQQVRQS